jgi:hypothetical protein
MAENEGKSKASVANIPEIEVTPEMIEAGVRAFELWDSADLPEHIVWSVYKAMELARRKATAVPILRLDQFEMAATEKDR